jgi:hypothetical protein
MTQRAELLVRLAQTAIAPELGRGVAARIDVDFKR